MKKLKKKFIKKLVLFVMFGCVVATCGCAKEKEGKENSSEINESHTSDDTKESSSVSMGEIGWDEVVINGEKIKLPCTVAELEQKGIIVNEYSLKSILEKPNETFYLVAATCGEAGNVYLHIETGSDVEKQKENAVVSNIANKILSKEFFGVKNEIGLGSTVDELLEVYGTDFYALTAKDEENLASGYVLIQYGTEKVGYLFHVDDGIIEYIEVFNKEGER